MNKKKIIISISFNTMFRNNKARLTKDWIDDRISIFMKYTMKSLKFQTNQNFIALLKYEDSTENIIKNSLSHYNKLPNNIQFVKSSEYDDKILRTVRGYEYLYLVRIDSDDMYHISYVQQLQDYDPKESTLALINQNGYIYDITQNRIARWSRTSPPFYTLIYKVKDYLTGTRYKLIGGHPGAIKLPHEIISKLNFMVTFHGNNTSTEFKSKDKNKIITNSYEVKNVLKNFVGNSLKSK